MPLDRGIIDQQLTALGEGGRWWNLRELRDLPLVLDTDDRILAVSRGRVGRVRWLRHLWLVVLTEKRLICLRSSPRGSWQQLEVPVSAVSRVSLRIGPFKGRVVVVTGGRTYRLLLPRTDAYRLQAAMAGLVQPGKSLVSGFGPARMARQVLDHVLALPAAALDPHAASEAAAPPHGPDNAGLRQQVHALEDQLQLLQQQVDFLEQLLQRSAAGRQLPGQPDAPRLPAPEDPPLPPLT